MKHFVRFLIISFTFSGCITKKTLEIEPCIIESLKERTCWAIPSEKTSQERAKIFSIGDIVLTPEDFVKIKKHINYLERKTNE